MAGRAIAGRHLVRLWSGNRWPVVIGLYDARECPWCGALVIGKRGQRFHQGWHDDLDTDLHGEETAPDPGGYVIGSGPLPAEIVRSDEEERERQR